MISAGRIRAVLLGRRILIPMRKLEPRQSAGQTAAAARRRPRGGRGSRCALVTETPATAQPAARAGGGSPASCKPARRCQSVVDAAAIAFLAIARQSAGIVIELDDRSECGRSYRDRVPLRLMDSVVMLSRRVRRERHKSDAHRETHPREFHSFLLSTEPAPSPSEHKGPQRRQTRCDARHEIVIKL